MYTVDRLLEIAVAAEAEYKKSALPKDRVDARRQQESAMICAQWMEQNGIKEMTHVGPFGENNFKPGQRVRIRKGAIVKGFGFKGEKVLTKSQIIKVSHVFRGYTHPDGPTVIHPTVEWAGTGGYWTWTHPMNVEAVAEAESAVPESQMVAA